VYLELKYSNLLCTFKLTLGIENEVVSVAFIQLSSFQLCDHTGIHCERGNIDGDKVSSITNYTIYHCSNNAYCKHHCQSVAIATISACYTCASCTKPS